MTTATEISVDRPIAEETTKGSVVQDRPSLGGLPGSRPGATIWLMPAVDLLASSATLLAVTQIANAAPIPALPIAPLVLVLCYAALGSYRSYRAGGIFGGEMGGGWLVVRLLVTTVFVWVASLFASMDSAEQVGLWVAFLAVDSVGRMLSVPAFERLQHRERWVLVGDESTATRLRDFEPLATFASIVGTLSPDQGLSTADRRSAAIDFVDGHHADRVVISSRHADDEGLVELVHDFKSIGVPVSLLPRPLDILDAPAATPSTVGGVPLIDVRALTTTRNAAPYQGPDRRRTRVTRVSVVIPAMNEGRNIGHVLSQLPEGLHEVILVDGNSTDDTIEAARAVRPDIKVLLQPGRGKGDAFRTAFAAVTGNLIVMLDADGSADPAEIPRFVAALERGADFAKGSRFLPGGGSDDITRLRSLGNSVLSGSANILHGTHFTDLCYGYNAFWARCLPFISLDVPGFEVETLINLRIVSAGMRITEVPSYERDRMHGQSNLNTFRDGWRVLRTIVGEAWRRREIPADWHKHRPAADAGALPGGAPAAR